MVTLVSRGASRPDASSWLLTAPGEAFALLHCDPTLQPARADVPQLNVIAEDPIR